MAPKDTVTKRSAKRSKSLTGSIVELVVIVAVALGLALAIQAVVIKPYRIPTGSMKPTLIEGSACSPTASVWTSANPTSAGIYVFHPPPQAPNRNSAGQRHTWSPRGGSACSAPVPEKASVNFIKRVVAGPEDEIYIKEGHVFRKAAGASKFLEEQDSYIKACGTSQECNFPKPIKIPRGHGS
jgi:signal peptidase I